LNKFLTKIFAIMARKIIPEPEPELEETVKETKAEVEVIEEEKPIVKQSKFSKKNN
jgi:hypothetical protein